jgi:hypothetical protein
MEGAWLWYGCACDVRGICSLLRLAGRDLGGKVQLVGDVLTELENDEGRDDDPQPKDTVGKSTRVRLKLYIPVGDNPVDNEVVHGVVPVESV